MKSRHPHVAPVRAPIAPLHRGPQALTPSTLTTPAVVHAPNAALLIDFDNVTMGIRSDLQTELRNLLSSDIIKGKVAVQRAYADWRRYPSYIVPLSEASIDLIFAPAYGSSKKNATDIRLAIDALELVFTRPEIGTFILLSGDSDFSSLVIKLKEYGKYVIGVGIRESSSDLLVQNCDEYYSYNALAGLVKTGETESTKWDPWELVTEAIGRMQRNGDVMRSDRLKQVMQEIDSTFDEKNLGISKFSKFCLEASQKGLLMVTKLENGQLEVAPPSGVTGERLAAHTAPQSEPAVAGGDGEEREGRGRRGRRGGRGRKRGEGREAPPAGGPVVQATRIVDTAIAAEHVPAPQAVASARLAAPVAPDSSIGASGMRLTRDEAFALIRDAVAALVTGDEVVPSEAVRRKALALLGRDSESLSDRNFGRILRDAHDGDVIDLRRRGDAWEVAAAAKVATVAEQLQVGEAAARAETPSAVVPPAPRGMGPRSAPGRGRGRGVLGGKVAPPPGLLLVGVVDDAQAAIVDEAAKPAKKPRRSRKDAAPAAADETPKPKRTRGKKAAATA